MNINKKIKTKVYLKEANIISNKINKLEINWNFLANHYLINSKTWKKNYLKGGGALNFYLIHIIFWLSNISNWKINHISKNRQFCLVFIYINLK